MFTERSIFVLSFLLPPPPPPPILQTMAKKWVAEFTEIYHMNRVTPYMHAMMCHCGQFLRRHGALAQFTQQGLEKYNDRLTKMFFR